MPRAEIGLAGAASLSALRSFVRRTLAEWHAGGHEWAAVTVTTELATNAVLHAATSYTVTLALDDEGVLGIEVRDGSPLVPNLRRYDHDATTGRGLKLVDQLSVSWEVEAIPDGKVVRCELAPATQEDSA